MLKFMEVTGKSEDEAISKGLAMLGLTRDDVSVEILERAKTGFLGIGSVPAKIRLSYECAEEAVQEVEEEHPVGECSACESVQTSTPCVNSVEVSEPAAEAAPEEVEQPCEAEGDEVEVAITQFQLGLFAHMGVEATPAITREGDTYSVVLQGEDMGPLIGRRGETLDAIQQLTGYVVNRGRAKRVRIHVDAEGYRARREEALERLAQKTAGKVVKYRRNMALEPMNAYERHVIHTALQDYPGVSTHSVGTEPNRRTVVTYDPEKA